MLQIVSIIPGQESCSEVVDQHITDSTVVWLYAFVWLKFLGEDNLFSLFRSFVIILGEDMEGLVGEEKYDQNIFKFKNCFK